MKSNSSINGFLSVLVPYIFALGLVVIFGFLKIWLENGVAKEKLEKKRIASLFIPHSGKLNIETLVYKTNGDEFITIKKTLKDVSFAQLKLYPSIGCTKPVLFYLVEGSSQIKQISVDEAKIIN